MLNENEKIFLKSVLMYDTYKIAAKKMGYSENELKHIIKRIYKKFGVFNRIQACIKLHQLENILIATNKSLSQQTYNLQNLEQILSENSS